MHEVESWIIDWNKPRIAETVFGVANVCKQYFKPLGSANWRDYSKQEILATLEANSRESFKLHGRAVQFEFNGPRHIETPNIVGGISVAWKPKYPEISISPTSTIGFSNYELDFFDDVVLRLKYELPQMADLTPIDDQIYVFEPLKFANNIRRAEHTIPLKMLTGEGK